MSLSVTLGRFAGLACRKSWRVLLQSSEHYSLCWLCCWARCWRLHDMDHMEESCILYVKVGMFDQLEHSKICDLTVTKMGIIMLTAQHDLDFSVSFTKDSWDFLRHTSPDVLSLEEFPADFLPSWDFGRYKPSLIPANKGTISDQITVNHGMVGNPCNL